MTHDEKVDFFVDKLQCSIAEAHELIAFDKDVDKVLKAEAVEKRLTKAKATKPKKGIQDEELEAMKKVLATLKEPFANKDLKPYLEGWGLNARQTPSRLKQLVKLGALEDLGGTPKQYRSLL